LWTFPYSHCPSYRQFKSKVDSGGEIFLGKGMAGLKSGQKLPMDSLMISCRAEYIGEAVGRVFAFVLGKTGLITSKK
jgi:hypothetical protein